ncbi:hypothetical protein AUJ77_00060 [Candidatus Nomurabacteria bacterium CG1_02_43_90]|uniref:Uncharacterized protein n=1 Tax=Candidatus Nomurabacteria bacterium CG1_02_43_90 TaxID=1805281 RepID=A0A1J4V995_9BACT|nr:MAG: hypothetical protein AUJ77_00060 [Candidatus Nomurabacteria bacterium CG1_02_43_90]
MIFVEIQERSLTKSQDYARFAWHVLAERKKVILLMLRLVPHELQKENLLPLDFFNRSLMLVALVGTSSGSTKGSLVRPFLLKKMGK